jgi:hypothetical protein
MFNSVMFMEYSGAGWFWFRGMTIGNGQHLQKSILNLAMGANLMLMMDKAVYVI